MCQTKNKCHRQNILTRINGHMTQKTTAVIESLVFTEIPSVETIETKSLSSQKA